MNPLFLVLLALFLFAGPASAQFGRKVTGGGFDSGSSSVGVTPMQPGKDKTIIIREVAVTPERTWKNRDGKPITAFLLAFPPEQGKEAPKDAPPVILKDGNVRLMRENKVYLLKLETLSIEDQVYIEKLLDTLKKQQAEKAKAASAAE